MTSYTHLMIAALEAAANGIIITDRDGTILWVNPAFTRLTGYTAAEAVGQHPCILKSGKQDQAFYRDLWETILSGRVWAKETINRRKDGSLYTEAQTITPVRDERGRIDHFISIKEDITERKRVEKALRESEARQRALEEAARRKSEFLANISHEFRTPLNAILGFSELLRNSPFGLLTEKQAQFVQNIRVSGKHLLSLINDLLDLSRAEASKIELRPEPFELREALQANVTEIQLQADRKRLALELRVDKAPSTLTADPVCFKQILLNLLSNAVKFTPDGGQITVAARRVSSVERGAWSVGPHPPSPGPQHPGEFVEIAVIDTGIGIKLEDLPRLFQEFVRLDAATALRTEGTGLGLALTKKLVELHGGVISASSEGEGRGSTFTVRLPIISSGQP